MTVEASVVLGSGGEALRPEPLPGGRVPELPAESIGAAAGSEGVDSASPGPQRTLSQERTLKEPKTKAARRKVYMTPVLAKTLRAFRAEQERKGVKHPEGLSMITREGTPISDDNYRTRVFKPTVAAAGIKTRCVPHTLRHSMLSMAATKGVPPTTIMAIAGHEDFRTTAEIYIGTPEASLAEAAAIVARAMG